MRDRVLEQDDDELVGLLKTFDRVYKAMITYFQKKPTIALLKEIYESREDVSKQMELDDREPESLATIFK